MVAYERVGVSSTQRATTSQVDFEVGNKQPSWLHLPTEKGHNNSCKYLEDPSSGHVGDDHTNRQIEKKKHQQAVSCLANETTLALRYPPTL